jgi:hypothetical protein
LIDDHPELANSLHDALSEWCDELTPSGLPDGKQRREQGWYDFYFDNVESR